MRNNGIGSYAMHQLTPQRLAEYLRHDSVAAALRETCHSGDESFRSQQWLVESSAKRLMYDAIYGDLLQPSATPKRILDVGGGFCSLSRRLIEKHVYRLLELSAHDKTEALKDVERQTGQSFWMQADWYDESVQGDWDLVIANDLFPNVDQRLAIFLDKFLPLTREVRLSLTYYDTPKFYLARRIEGDEILCVLAWDGERTRQVLDRYRARVIDPEPAPILAETTSIFPNGRQVSIVRLVGDAK